MKVLSDSDTSVLYVMQGHMDRARKELAAAQNMFFGITVGTPEDSARVKEDLDRMKEYLANMEAGLRELTEDLCLMRENIEDGELEPELPA